MVEERCDHVTYACVPGGCVQQANELLVAHLVTIFAELAQVDDTLRVPETDPDPECPDVPCDGDCRLSAAVLLQDAELVIAAGYARLVAETLEDIQGVLVVAGRFLVVT